MNIKKIVYFTALKSIIGEVVEEGFEPYALSRPNEEISSTIAPGSILARMEFVPLYSDI